MAVFDLQSKCARWLNEDLGSDYCVLKKECKLCNALTCDWKSQLSTSNYKTQKEKKMATPQLVVLRSVQILGPVDACLSDSQKVATMMLGSLLLLKPSSQESP